MPTINVATEAQLRDAIFTASNDFANGGAYAGPYTINIVNPPGGVITLTQSLPMIRGPVPGDGSTAITINGNGHSIDANNTGRVFFVESGAVAINNVVIDHAFAQGGDGGDAASSTAGGAGGGGLGAGAAVFVNAGAVVTLAGVTVPDAAAVGGAGGNGGGEGGVAISGGGGGGLGGDGGSGAGAAGGGGGGYAGTGGSSGSGGGGGGGEFGAGGDGAGGGGGGGGQQGIGGAGSGGGGGGGGGGATLAGNPGGGSAGGAGGNPEGGDGGSIGVNGNKGDDGSLALGGGGGGAQGGPGGAGQVSGGGGGGGFFFGGTPGAGGLGGGGGGASNQNGGAGGDFRGGGGAPTIAGGTGGTSAFGGGGGSGATGGTDIGVLGGQGGSALGADGGGGAALGGAIFVRNGGSLIINDSTTFTGVYTVTGGTTGGTGGAQAGAAQGKVMFLHGTGTTTFAVGGGQTRTIGGTDAIAGDGTLGKDGEGTLVLQDIHANFLGTARVDDGLFRVDGSIAGAKVTVNSGGTLGGNGTTGAVTVNAGGTLLPGASAGILRTGNLALFAGASFEIEFGGTNPGIGGYDQVKVTGTASLGGSSLLGGFLGMPSFVPTPGEKFTIIENDGSDAVAGTFAGLFEGAYFAFGNRAMFITYKGGDGNDVVLTATTAVIKGTSGSDLIHETNTVDGQALPTTGGDTIMGKRGKDDLSGHEGDDTMKGGRGKDIVNGESGDDALSGGKGKDEMLGGDGNDSLDGGGKRDSLDGGAGDDWLDGGRGRDLLTGGEGDDTFALAHPNKPDKVTDFAEGDIIALENSAFSGIGPKGALKAAYFRDGAVALTTEQKILYDEDSGWLLYAENGSDTANPVAFARIGKNFEGFDHADILVI